MEKQVLTQEEIQKLTELKIRNIALTPLFSVKTELTVENFKK